MRPRDLSRRHHLNRLLPALLVVGLAACGSTVRVQATTEGGAPEPAGFAAETPPGTTPTPTTAAPAPGSTAPDPTSPSAIDARSPTVGSAEGAGVATPAPGSAAPTPGTDAPSESLATPDTQPTDTPRAADLAPIQIGAVTFPDLGAAAASLGGEDNGDLGQEDILRLMFDWVNANGGLAGHRAELVATPVNLTSVEPYSQSYQRICTQWTEDHDVQAGLFIGNADDIFPACLGDRGVMLYAVGKYMRDQQSFAHLPYLVAPAEAATDRVTRAMADQMVEAGVAESGSRVGLLVMDYDAARRAADLLGQILAARGVNVTVVEIPPPNSTGEVATSVTSVQSAQLRMRTENVQAVVSLCPGCLGFFMQAAGNQGFYPRYVFSSLDTPGGLADGGSARQFQDAIGIGWNPLNDVGTYTNPDVLAGNATHQQCSQILGELVRDDTTEFAAHSLCDAVLFIKAAADAAGPDGLDGAAMLAGAESLGTSWPSAATFRTMLGPGRRDGATAFRRLQFDDGCGCMRYVGELRSFR